MTKTLRFHRKGENRTPEFVALVGVAGIIGNIIIGETTTHETLTEEAKGILGRTQLMTYFEQAANTNRLPMRNCVAQAINLARIYLNDLLTKSEGAFKDRVSTAMSYIIIAARTIFDHIPTLEEQRTEPTTTPFFRNYIMGHKGVTNRSSILRQAMTTLGTDDIINTHNLKPKESFSRYPTGIYAMNLLMAGGFNTNYYRNQEGTKETLYKTAFVMATGYSQALDCTENPNSYEIVLKACEHRMAKSCLQFKPTTTNGQTAQVHPTDTGPVNPTDTGPVHPKDTGQVHSTDQKPVCPTDQNTVYNLDQDQEPETQTVTHTQQTEPNIPASVPSCSQGQTKAKKQAQPPPPPPPIACPLFHRIREQHYNHQETKNYQGKDRGDPKGHSKAGQQYISHKRKKITLEPMNPRNCPMTGRSRPLQVT